MGIFDGLIDQANQVLTQPTGGGDGGGGGIPWGKKVYTAPEGPYGNVYPAGTLYSVDGSGDIQVEYSPPKASSGGGGSPVIVNASTGGSKFMVMYGPEGYGTYEVSSGTPILIGLKQDPNAAPVNPADKNNDGLDDTTNWALGVYQDKNSPTGYSYGQGQPVYPNGAPYQGGANTGAAPQLVNGKYVWDGSKFVIAPGLESTASSGSGGGGSYSVSGPRVSSISSGGSSSGTARDYAAEQAAQNAAQAQMQKDSQAFTASQNALDRAQKDAQFQANYGLSVQQFQAQQAKDAADARLGLIDRYGAAVSDTDQAKLQSLRMALGNGTGDVSLVDLLRNAGPGAFQANEAAAALLGEIRGQPASPTGTGMAPVTSPTGTGGTGTPATTGTPGMTPVTTPTGATDPAVVAAQQAAAAAQQDATIRANLAANQRGADQQTISQNNAAITAWYDPANWKNIGNNNPTGGGVDYYQSTITGEKVPATIWSQMLQDNQGAAQKENQYQQFWAGANVTAPDNPGSGYNPTYRPQAVDALGQVSGVSSQTYNPYAPNYTGPVAGTMPYGNDNVSNPMPTGNLANDNIMNPMPTTTVQGVVPGLAGGGGPAQTNPQPWTPPQVPGVPLLNIDPNATAQAPTAAGYNQTTNNLTNRAWIPGLAHGSERPQMGPIVTGDPQVPGQPNPELTVWTPQGNIVRPLNQMHPGMRPVMDGLPHAALGTSVFSSPWARFGGSSPLSGSTTPTTTQTAIPAIPKTATTGVDPSTMVGTTSTPGQTSYTPMTPLTAPSTIPSGQQSATVPTSSYPNTGTMQPVTQPTTVGGTTVTTTPVPNPADPLALTPQSTQYINDVANFRNTFWRPTANQLDVSFDRTAPSFQRSVQQGEQTASGMPIEDQQWYRQRYQFAGRPTMSSVAGY